MNAQPPFSQSPAPQPPPAQPRGPRSMQADVETWTDTCSCEPEPRWQALADELESPTPPRAAGTND